MAWSQLAVRIRGTVPLLMHSGQLANPLADITKQVKKVSGKRAKTDADHEELARLEWLGSLYLRDGRPCLPGMNLEKALVEAARKSKRGKQAMAGILCPEDAFLEYEGPKDPKQLWERPEFRFVVGVKVQMARDRADAAQVQHLGCQPCDSV